MSINALLRSALILMVICIISCKKNDSDPTPTMGNQTELTVKSNVQSLIYGNVGEYCAFTDLIKFKGSFYIIFRQGKVHASTSDFGSIVILKSGDFKTWKKIASFSMAELDLRDPKFLLMKDKLYVNCIGVNFGDSGWSERLHNIILALKIDNDAASFSIHRNKVTNYWAWSYVFDDITSSWYTFGYNNQKGIFKMIQHEDGINDEDKTTDFSYLKNVPTEAKILFNNNKMYALVRRDYGKAVLGESSRPDFSQMKWKDLPLERLGGPNMLFYKNILLIAGRDFIDGQAKTTIFEYNLDKNTTTRLMVLSSNGDTSYPGMYLDGNKLYISYYTTVDGFGKIATALLTLS